MLALSTKAAALATAAMIVAAAPARALGDTTPGTEQRLLVCAEISKSTERLACFNAVAESLEQASSEPLAEASPEAGPDSASDSPTEHDVRKNVPQPTPTVVRPEPVIDGAASRSGDTDDEEQAKEPIQAIIVSSWQNLDGRFSVELDNGQVWRETQGTKVGLPEEGDSVEIRKGLFGGYRMKIENIRRIAWVSRTK